MEEIRKQVKFKEITKHGVLTDALYFPSSDPLYQEIIDWEKNGKDPNKEPVGLKTQKKEKTDNWILFIDEESKKENPNPETPTPEGS